jgi:xanthine dehydrogenase accessory factor
MEPAMQSESLYTALAAVERGGQAAALCTIIRARGSVPRHVGSKMLVYADGRFVGTIGGGEMESRVIQSALEAITSRSPQTVHHQLINPAAGDPGVCGGEVEIFVEPIQPLPSLLVIGGGHVGRAVVHLGRWLGFRVAVSDDRPEYCTPETIPGADVYLPLPPRELPSAFQFSDETYIVLTTRGVPLDLEALPHLLAVPHAYLGVIGSGRRWATAARRLAELGVRAEALARVHSPMGLELNAETPEEIAVSILAEIIQLRRGGTGGSMQINVPAAALTATPPAPATSD